MEKLWFIDNVPISLRNDFEKKMLDISDKLGINANWLMAVMMLESGVNPKIVNPVGGATGLIQFMPKTAIGLGTSTENLKKLNHVQQLDYVYKYFYPYRGKLKSGEDLYLATFYPYALNKSEDYIFGSEKGNEYSLKISQQNPGLMKFSDDNYLSKKEWKQNLRFLLEKRLGDIKKVNFFFHQKTAK